ncbi:MAG: MFS transporter [Paracoccaceae bacterium]|nr:MFS transporter [Paracoccaceae bacterium]
MRALIQEGARARVSDLRAVFGIRAFAIYQIGGIVMTTGFWMQRVAVGWVTWQLTGSEAWLGFMAFAELFPSIFTGLWGGRLSDRAGAPVVMFWGNLALVLVSLALFALDVTGGLTAWRILALMTLIGGISGLILPPRLAMSSFLVPARVLPAALAVNSIGFNMSRFIGPAIAAGVMVVGAPWVVFACSAAGYGAFSLALWLIRKTPPQSVATRRAGDNGSTWAALRALITTPLVLAVILIQLVVGMLIRPATELFPAFAETVFNRGEAGLGYLNAALGLGAILGALLLSRSRSGAESLRQIVWGSVVFGVTILAFVVTGQFWLALAILVVHGIAMTSSNIAALTYVQTHTAPDRLGRVLSAYALVFRAGPAIGAFLFGATAEGIGLMATGLGFGVIGLAATAVLGLFIYRHQQTVTAA